MLFTRPTTFRHLAALGATAALLGAGCASDGGPVVAATETTLVSDTTTVTAPVSRRSIIVTATGEASGVPDSMALTLAVEVRGATTAEALAAATDRSAALRDHLVGSGVDESDLQSTSLSVYPNYSYSDEGVSTIDGYNATVSLTVRTTDLDGVSGLVDGAAAVVGDAFRVNGLQWSMSNTDELTALARTNAVAAARTTATQLAVAGGLELGAVVQITESGTGAPPYGYGYGEGDSSAIPFDPGTGKVAVSVTVEFAAE